MSDLTSVKTYIFGSCIFCGGMSYQFGLGGLAIGIGVLVIIGSITEFIITRVRQP